MIVAGFGFRRGAGAASLQNALDAAQQGLPAVTHLATAQDKAAALAPLAQRLGLPVVALQGGALILAPTTTLSLA
ncbi:MAG TPA: cobalamin biosynthesis protein, partial [Novosphingobium sp.]|nr:cobalamin biosynthesis protein [Novosphingobium sp.]